MSKYFRHICSKLSEYIIPNKLSRDKCRQKWNYMDELGKTNFLEKLLQCYISALDFRQPEINLAITAIVKNEAPYLREWIVFHKLVGVEKFFIYDNGSTDSIKEVLQPYIECGDVIYRYYPGSCAQCPAYTDSIIKNRHKVKFMAFVDIDEFITPIKHDNILDFIDYLEKKIHHKIDAVGINWLMHGFNGHYEKTEGLVCENFSKCDFSAGSNQHVKSIVRPKSVIACNNPHYFIYKLFSKIVNTAGEDMYGPFTKIILDEILINHYWTRSYSEMQEKIQRGRATCNEQRENRPYIPEYLSTDEDNSMVKFIPLLKEKLKR